MTHRLLTTCVALAAFLAGCGVGGTAGSTGSTATPTTEPGSNAPSGAQVLSGTNPSPASMANGGRVMDRTLGFGMTFPPGWLVLTPESISDPTALASLKEALGSKGRLVDDLVNALTQHPEYWFAAARVSDQNVAVGQLHNIAPGSWPSGQEALLRSAYPSVGASPLLSPRPGEAFTFEQGGRAGRVYGFPRPNGNQVVVIVFASPTAEPGPGWDDVVATFTDPGT